MSGHYDEAAENAAALAYMRQSGLTMPPEPGTEDPGDYARPTVTSITTAPTPHPAAPPPPVAPPPAPAPAPARRATDDRLADGRTIAEVMTEDENAAVDAYMATAYPWMRDGSWPL